LVGFALCAATLHLVEQNIWSHRACLNFCRQCWHPPNKNTRQLSGLQIGASGTSRELPRGGQALLGNSPEVATMVSAVIRFTAESGHYDFGGNPVYRRISFRETANSSRRKTITDDSSVADPYRYWPRSQCRPVIHPSYNPACRFVSFKGQWFRPIPPPCLPGERAFCGFLLPLKWGVRAYAKIFAYEFATSG